MLWVRRVVVVFPAPSPLGEAIVRRAVSESGPKPPLLQLNILRASQNSESSSSADCMERTESVEDGVERESSFTAVKPLPEPTTWLTGSRFNPWLKMIASLLSAAGSDCCPAAPHPPLAVNGSTCEGAVTQQHIQRGSRDRRRDSIGCMLPHVYAALNRRPNKMTLMRQYTEPIGGFDRRRNTLHRTFCQNIGPGIKILGQVS